MKKRLFGTAASAVLGLVFAWTARAEGYVIEAGEDWIPLAYSKDVVKGSALDVSQLGLLDAPAGKYGWLKTVGPRFEFEQKPGVSQRFYGANLCMEACFPRTEEEADKLIARLVRTGYNSIRIHHHDAYLYRLDGKQRPILNEPYAERFDRFMAKAIEAGLYITTDLYVSRRLSWAEVGDNRYDSKGLDFKMLLFFHDGAMESWKQAARALFAHRNPHTGRTYAEEPALAFICLVNENSLQQSLDGQRKNPYVREAWKKWLLARRAENPTCWPSLTPEEVPEKSGGWSPNPVLHGEGWDAVARFCAEHETRMFGKMKKFLREELGVKALLTDQNWGTQNLPMQAVRARHFDYADAHMYVDHPVFPNNDWKLPSVHENDNVLARKGWGLETPWVRVANKPFTVSEWNFCGPSRFRANGGICMASLAAIQDWGALWRFSYSHWFEAYRDTVGHPGYFDIVNDPVGLLSERLAVPLFLRRDLETPQGQLTLELTDEAIGTKPRDFTYSVLPRWYGRQWTHRVGNALPGEAPAGSKVIPYGDATTNAAAPAVEGGSRALALDYDRGVMSVATPRTCAAYVPTGRVEAGFLSVDLTGAPACVWATSLDGRPLTDSRRILVMHLGDVQSVGTTYADKGCHKVLKWGDGRMLMKRSRAEIVLKGVGDGLRLWALDMSGRRLRELPLVRKDGAVSFVADVAADPAQASFAYELSDEAALPVVVGCRVL